MGNSPLLSKHWKDWAAALRAEYSARPKPATPCGASDCSFWPFATVTDANGARNATAVRSNPDSKHHSGTTLNDAVYNWAAPQARDHFPAHSPEYVAAKKAQGHGMRNLNDEAETWRAPHAQNVSGRGEYTDPEKIRERHKAGHQINLSEQVTLVMHEQNWAAPVAMNHKGSSQGSITRQDGKSRMNLLHYQAEQGFDPATFHLPSSPDQPIAGGSMSSTDSPNSNQPSVKRKLNPIFVEALMRWPTGLSGFERPETAWTRWLQLQHSYLLALASGYSPSQKGLFE